MKYYNWIKGNKCCEPIKNCGCNKDVCDCENILLSISKLGTDDEILQDEIDYLSGVVDTITFDCDCDDFYTKEEIDASLSGYATENWVLNNYQPKGNYLTEHQPLKTINGNVISGTGNIVIEASGTPITVDEALSLISTNPVENKVITEALNDKLDASAYTPTDLSNYYTKLQTDELISGLTYQISLLMERLRECCPSPTPVSPTEYKYTGTTSGGNEINIDCCEEPGCNELVAHDITEKSIQTGNLKTINVGECITSIGTDAFYGELNLTDVVLPNSLQYIKDVMLHGCTSMQTLTILTTTPPTFIGTGGNFYGLFSENPQTEVIPEGFKIKVPLESVMTYKTANVWSRYSDYIEAI